MRLVPRWPPKMSWALRAFWSWGSWSFPSSRRTSPSFLVIRLRRVAAPCARGWTANIRKRMAPSRTRRGRGPDHREEVAVQAGGGAELRVERPREHTTLAGQNGLGPPGGEDLGPGADPDDARRADEDHRQRPSSDRGDHRLRLERLLLPPVGVALHVDVDEAEGGL